MAVEQSYNTAQRLAIMASLIQRGCNVGTVHQVATIPNRQFYLKACSRYFFLYSSSMYVVSIR